MLDGKLAGGNDTLCFVSDIEQNFVSVDFDNCAFDEVTVVEELQGLFDLGQEVVCAANVVDGYLLRAFGRSGCHAVSAPMD